MKKVTFFACAAAMMLASVAFTGCKSEEPQGNYNGDVVKTEFSISLPGQAVRQNMPSATVQKAGLTEFQGMTHIILVPFAETAAITGSNSRLGDTIHLSDIASYSSSTTEFGTNSKAKVYENVSIPLTTGSFLFYAKSAASGTKFQTGSLEAGATIKNNNTPSGYEFQLEPIVSANGAPTAAGTSGIGIITYLNTIAAANDGDATTPIAWKDYTANNGRASAAAMTAMFDEFKSLKTISTFGVARMLTDLYKSLEPLAASLPLAANIRTAINNSTYVTITSNVVSFKSPYDNFPAEFNLPDGAVPVKYDAGAFAAFADADYSTNNRVQLATYTYPSALWYYTNSVIRTSNSSKKDLYDNVNTWNTILNAHTDAPAVNSLTRAVAIENVIQYAVARLDVVVKLQNTTLDDNTPVHAQSINCSSYPVTAVLVGGQKNVGFDFTPKGSTEYTLYDKVMTGTVAAEVGGSGMNSTLVLESEVGSGKDVMIAVELQNASGSDFIGVDGNVIPAGGKFYLIGKLVAAADATKTSDVNPNQVFKQDYTTTANLTIKSLKNAYNTIPDLRTPELELGFSVDLTWQAGNVYNVDLP